jgi:polyribonucleotide nucleotidyltransferase
MGLDRKQFTTEYAGQTLTMEVSRLAEQATTAVLGKYGDTTVLVTTVMANEDRDVSYFPLVVDYEERFYAAGKIIGSRFVRREGRPSEEAILSGRIIDRTIRPLFDHRIRRPVQVVVTILTIDEENDPDFIALLTASTALAISPIPWKGPVAGVKFMQRSGSGDFVVNPVNSEVAKGFDFVSFTAGTKDRISMIELEGIESQEDAVASAFAKAQGEVQKLVAWQEGIIKEIGREKAAVPMVEVHEEVKEKIAEFLSTRLEKAMYVPDKKAQSENMAALSVAMHEHLKAEGVDEAHRKAADHFLEEATDALVHKNILEKDMRPDGRALDEVRELYGEVGLFKRTHGSGIFMRGNTQALAVTTLGPPSAEQMVESIEFSGKKRFLLHYNFPAYSVGETGPFRGPGRREIGHGALAMKALKNMVPASTEFPYTIRVVSEVLSSNGSSSMATVCASTLSLMDAGVPIKKAVAGIAMGIITDATDSTYKVLCDIQGPEDHYGDMDFKVAGTRDGITAIQMDVKIQGLTQEMLVDALAGAKTARYKILDVLEKVIAEPRKELSPYAPMIVKTSVAPAKIGEVIGPGGKMINGIIERTGVTSIDIDDDGSVFITADSADKARAALAEVESIGKVLEVGEMVEGKVVKIMDFGAIVQFGPHSDGMVHVSELKDGGFIKNVTDVVQIGDHVRAKIIRVEDGRTALSMRGVEQPEAR